MPKYLCPVINCNISLEGSITDIIPPAIGHAGGSHNIALTEGEVATLISKQADPNYIKGEPEKKVEEKNESIEQPVEEIPVTPVVDLPVISKLKGFTDKETNRSLKDWWKKTDKKL